MHEGHHGILDEHNHNEDKPPKNWQKLLGALIVVLVIGGFILFRQAGC